MKPKDYFKDVNNVFRVVTSEWLRNYSGWKTWSLEELYEKHACLEKELDYYYNFLIAYREGLDAIIHTISSISEEIVLRNSLPHQDIVSKAVNFSGYK